MRAKPSLPSSSPNILSLSDLQQQRFSWFVRHVDVNPVLAANILSGKSPTRSNRQLRPSFSYDSLSRGRQAQNETALVRVLSAYSSPLPVFIAGDDESVYCSDNAIVRGN
jgi:hypothetical protein